MSRYRFALRPKWILSHLFVLALVVAMIGASFWQFDRLAQRKARNARVLSRRDMPVVPIGAISTPGDPYSSSARLEFRRVTATGRYRADQEVLVRSRSRNGAPGSWILTPVDIGGGREVVVNRGWVRNSGTLTSVPPRFRAPGGTVKVTGLVRQTETRGAFGPRDPRTGTLDNLARADIARLDQQLPERLFPLWVQLLAQDPPVRSDDPLPVPAPALDEGPHLSYAIQWLIFTTVALVGYPLILRRRAGEIEREETTTPGAGGSGGDGRVESGDAADATPAGSHTVGV